MISAEAIEEAAKGIASANLRGKPWDALNEEAQNHFRRDAKAALEAASTHILAEATRLIADLTDSEDCWFDHHGGCQAHGYLDLASGEACPQAEAKAWAESHKAAL